MILQEGSSVKNPDSSEKRLRLMNLLTDRMSVIKQSAGEVVLFSIDENRLKRYAIAKEYEKCLRNLKGVTLFEADIDSYFNRFPVLLDNLDARRFEAVSRFGLSRLYGTESELYSSQMGMINSRFFYENLITLPIYADMKKSTVTRICSVIPNLITE